MHPVGRTNSTFTVLKGSTHLICTRSTTKMIFDVLTDVIVSTQYRNRGTQIKKCNLHSINLASAVTEKSKCDGSLCDGLMETRTPGDLA